ncbi:NTP transferase domain-containing protein [Methylicorpusculum oleiharenae]|uniref:NTP transferase domain-containing protein n=1 Tax=Methylicorpusculum oleiharenae TaxID=1338687 RepID=UPI00135C78FC|nr:NTP transferase domain-containing protein [Methylicorpusculum oleiharenae]MCD2449100.1 NTP transferase domain-containing protein [Methylicorpusculum oleiharenae]
MPPIKHAVISAAGIGSRLGLDKPKCMVEVLNRTLLDYHVERLHGVETLWVVVGFHEDVVIQHALSLRRDIIIVRNPEYARTNTLQSIYRVARHLKERVLVIDADTVLEDNSFYKFVVAAEEHSNLLGVSRYTTSDGVRAQLDTVGRNVIGFSRHVRHEFEWTGIAVIEPHLVVNKPIYVYQALESHLPLPAFELKAFDIDTTADLDMARHVMAKQWS